MSTNLDTDRTADPQLCNNIGESAASSGEHRVSQMLQESRPGLNLYAAEAQSWQIEVS